MKKLPFFLAGASAAILAVLLVSVYKRRDKQTVELDGEVRDNTDPNAPKIIKSDFIVGFSCEISTIADLEEDSFSGKVYRLEASFRDGAVKGGYHSRDRFGVSEDVRFARSVRFMRQLYGIVSRYDLAQYNGISYNVSALPDNYGAMLEVKFSSGERISACDNQSCFIPREAIEELVGLFREAAGIRSGEDS